MAAETAPGLADRFTKIGEERVFVLHRPTPDADVTESVYLSQRDVRELQFAKAAIATGWTLLLEQLGLEHGDVQQVLLAGSFGSYLSPASAIRIGLVPTLPVLRIVSAGNVAGEGAKMALLSLRERAGAASAAEGGGVCRAQRPRRLQRQVRRAARLPLTDSPDRLRRDRPAGSPDRRVAVGRSMCTRCHRCCTTSPAGSPARSSRSHTLLESYDVVAVGYADCGTYGALDEVCDRLGLKRLEGLHCYDVYAGASRVEEFFADQPGTYLLTDFLVKSFARTVETELGLDRHPELLADYFGHYTRVVWLAQEETPELREAAEAAARSSVSR